MANSTAANEMSIHSSSSSSYNIMNDEDVHGVMDAMCGDLFDHIDDLLDFPKEDAADVLLLDAPAPNHSPSAHIIMHDHSHDIIGDYNTIAAPMIEPLLQQQEDHEFFDVVVCGDSKSSLFDAKSNNLGSCDELDMAQLEWLSNFFDDTAAPEDPFANLICPVQPLKDSFAVDTNTNAATDININTNANANSMPVKEDTHFGSSSPVSVLEQNSYNVINGGLGVSISSSSSSMSSSSDSFSGGGSSSSRASSGPISPGTTQPPPVLVIPARARSKRSRSSAFSARINHDIGVPLAPPPASDAFIHSATMVPSSASSLSDPESMAESNTPASPMKKKKSKKPSISIDADEDYDEGGIGLVQGPVRRCMHCLIEKTPQWRAGPMGPKTLCNACGVRYKSGRLFPEYRPAASPTFVPSVHSNSHKKVVEMRLKTASKGDPSCDLLQFIRRKD